MSENRKTSINDIARLAGVSVATVSHVINRTGRYSQKTEEKVRAIIDQVGYVSNNAARSLKSSRSHTVGLILPNIGNDFFSSIAVSIEQFFDAHDYSLFICNTDNNPEKEARYFRKLDSMQVDGIIVISCEEHLDNDLINRNIPVILLDRTPENNMNLLKVTSDAREGIFSATERLIEKGCRNIIFISSFLASYVHTNRVDGYIEAMKKHGLYKDASTIIQLGQGPSLINAELEIMKYVNEGNPVDGIICTSDNQAIGAMTALKRLNMRIPEEVKVFGFDNQFQSRICSPTLSTIERDPSHLAVKAAELLLNKITNAEEKAENITLHCTLVERESTM